MANEFLNETVYSNTMLLLLKNQLVYGRLVDGQYKNEVTDENGLVINIKTPPEFVAQSGPTLQTQRMIWGSRSVAVDQYYNVHIGVGDLESIQSENDLVKSSYMASAASALAHNVEGFLAQKTLEFPSIPDGADYGETIYSPAEFNAAHTQLMGQSVPNENLNSVVRFKDGEKIRGSLLSGNIDGTNKTALERVKIPILSEIDVYASQSVPTFTTGDHTFSSGPAIDGAGQNKNYTAVKGSMTQTLNLKAVGNSKTVKKYTTFTIAGVYEYDSRAQKVLSNLRRFVVLEDAESDETGDVALTVYPAMIVPETTDGTDTIANTSFATVSAAPADSAAVTFDGAANTTYTVPTAFHKRAIALVSAKLRKPMTGVSSFSTDPETGISIRYWRGSDISTGQHIHRWDMVYGAEVVDRRLGTRVFGVTPS